MKIFHKELEEFEEPAVLKKYTENEDTGTINGAYTAEDGLALLDYLGLTDLDDDEKDVFRERWDEFYEARANNIVMATWTLYASALPYICGDNDRVAFVNAQRRDYEFGAKLETTDLMADLESGIALQDIIDKGK